MQGETVPSRQGLPHVVIVGGGIAALEAVLALRAVAGDRVDIDVWADDEDFTYRPLSVAEPFLAGEVPRIPLEPLVKRAGAVLRRGRVISVDPLLRMIETDTGAVSYDVLLLALGARSTPAVDGALTFRGPEDDGAIRDLLRTVVAGGAQRLAFVLPTGPTRPLPLYELALETRAYLSDRGTRNIEITVVTPERSPLEFFGPEAGDEIEDLLAERGIELIVSASPQSFVSGELHLSGHISIAADHVIAMARLEGSRLPGIPCDDHGFVPIDHHSRVGGLDDVYAAGEMTDFPIKHGGIAAQQADTAAEAIAARIGVPIEPTPFHPVLRGQVLTGIFPRYLHLDESGTRHTLTTQAPWWPPAKIVGRHLTPFLAKHAGIANAEAPEGAIVHDTAIERLPDGTWAPI